MENYQLSLTILILFFVKYEANGQLLNSVSGEVSSGNFTYYSLMYEGPITLYLHSRSGDADLYVSQYTSKPSFEPENYCLQSSTCGLDVVYLPKSFKRPVGIAVYGHPSHEFTEYYLEVVYRQSKDVFVFGEEVDDNEEGGDIQRKEFVGGQKDEEDTQEAFEVTRAIGYVKIGSETKYISFWLEQT